MADEVQWNLQPVLHSMSCLPGSTFKPPVEQILWAIIIKQKQTGAACFWQFTSTHSQDLLSLMLSFFSLGIHVLKRFTYISLRCLLTTVRVDAAVVQESNPQVVQDSRLMEEAESSEVILTLQDVWVPQWWEIIGRLHWVLYLLPMENWVICPCWKFNCLHGVWRDSVL